MDRVLCTMFEANGPNVIATIVMPSRVYRVVGEERSSNHHLDPFDQGRYVEAWLRKKGK